MAISRSGKKATRGPRVIWQNVIKRHVQADCSCVWKKNPKIKKELQGFMAHDIDQECNQLCSKKNPSIFRKTDKDSLLSFTMQKLYQEVEEKAPLLHSLLHAASHNKSSRAKQTKDELMNAGTAMAATICLRNRSKNMIAVQLIVTIILYHNNWLVSDFISCICLEGILL